MPKQGGGRTVFNRVQSVESRIASGATEEYELAHAYRK